MACGVCRPSLKLLWSTLQAEATATHNLILQKERTIIVRRCKLKLTAAAEQSRRHSAHEQEKGEAKRRDRLVCYFSVCYFTVVLVCFFSEVFVILLYSCCEGCVGILSKTKLNSIKCYSVLPAHI